jgi:pimeloyl-ACP methyl ester carboxylesterase
VGASAVARAAANDASVAAVVLYATWPSLREETSYKEPHGRWATELALLGFRASGVAIDEIRPEADLARISPRPLLFVAGGRDSDTPLPIMARMYAAAGANKEWWLVPEAEHGGCFAAEPAEYERRVVGFLDRALAAPR